MIPGLADDLLRAYFRLGWRGFYRVWGLMGRRSGGTIRFRTPYGTCFDLDPWAYIDGIVLREGYYESEVLDAVVLELGGRGVLWDIGANFGLHGLTTQRLVPGAKVVCFEPSPAIVGRLWRNRSLNCLEVDVVAAALSDRTDFQIFHVAAPGNPGMSTLSPWEGAQYECRTLVPTVRGDELVLSGQVAGPTVIKLDVEGHELPVLRGLAHALATSCRAVVFEDGPEAGTPVKALLAAAGFGVDPLIRAEQSGHSLVNFVARRK